LRFRVQGLAFGTPASSHQLWTEALQHLRDLYLTPPVQQLSPTRGPGVLVRFTEEGSWFDIWDLGSKVGVYGAGCWM